MTPAQSSNTIHGICTQASVIPVLVLGDAGHARPLAQALLEGGLPVLEVTLRTPQALEVIAEMATVEGAIVGAGTVLSPKDVQDAKSAGAQFAVSPGTTSRLLEACEEAELPLLPGAATTSEAMRLFERGYRVLKFFPAQAAGGAGALKAIGAPLPEIMFCPTGGVSLQNAKDYLSLPNVICVGGSWVAPADKVDAQDWGAITALARQAAGL